MNIYLESPCSCDYDPPAWITRVKAARKLRRCDECGCDIRPGESYENVCGKVSTFHTCVRCVELREWACISVPCFCWTYGGEMHEEVREMVREVAPHIPGFFMEFGRRMVKIRQRANSDRKARTP
jgi:hypothetical protein